MRLRELEDLLAPLGMVAVGVLSTLAADSVAATIATALLFAAAEAGLLAWRFGRARLGAPGLLLAVVAGLAAMLTAPRGLAEIPVLVAASRLPRVLPARTVDPALVVVSVLFGVDVAVISHSVAGLLAGIGVYVVGQRTRFVTELETERDRAVALLAEVEAARGAEAAAAAAAERVRIARDLHDVLAHSLAGLSLQLQAVRAVATREGVGAAVTGPLDDAAALARDGVVEARRAVSALQGPGGPGLAELPVMVDRFPGAARLRVDGAGQLPADAANAVYRAVQEALTNAARYAPGAAVDVALTWSAGRLVATVINEAPTHAPTAEPAAGGAGLVGMVERLAAVGGRATAGPAAGGWVVRLEVPR